MKNGAPAFQFYASDFRIDEDVMAMTPEARGVYIILLCVCWCEHGLRPDPNYLATAAMCSQAVLKRVWTQIKPCFELVEGRLQSSLLDKERIKQAHNRKVRSKAGIASGEARRLRAVE